MIDKLYSLFLELRSLFIEFILPYFVFVFISSIVRRIYINFSTYRLLKMHGFIQEDKADKHTEKENVIIFPEYED